MTVTLEREAPAEAPVTPLPVPAAEPAPAPATAGPAFGSLLDESAEDLDLRRKLAAGRKGRVP